jgi:hypothetical protein
MSLGPATAAAAQSSAPRCDRYPSYLQTFHVVVRPVIQSDRTSLVVLETLPGVSRDVLNGYSYVVEDPGKWRYPVQITGPFSDDEIHSRFGPFETATPAEFWVLHLPRLDVKTPVLLAAVHRESGRDPAGAPCSVDVLVKLLRFNPAD